MDNPKPSTLNQGQDISPEYNGQSEALPGGLLTAPFRNLLKVAQGSGGWGGNVIALGTVGGAYYGYTKKGWVGALIGLYVGSVLAIVVGLAMENAMDKG
jgi:hypothetical protein